MAWTPNRCEFCAEEPVRLAAVPAPDKPSCHGLIIPAFASRPGWTFDAKPHGKVRGNLVRRDI